MTIAERLKDELLVLDGAMGTRLMQCGVSAADCCDRFCVTNPDIVYDIHKSYLAAGADILTTNTFNVNSLPLEKSEEENARQIRQLSRCGVLVARRAVDDFCSARDVPTYRRPYVAGCIGPGRISLSKVNGEDGAQLVGNFQNACELQAATMIDAGTDLLLMETYFDLMNIQAACHGVQRAFRQMGRQLPLMISVTLTDEGRLFSGHTLAQLVDAVEQFQPLSVGINCCNADEQLREHIMELAGLTHRYVSVHPNAGFPDEMGLFRTSPNKMAAFLHDIISDGCVNIVGGCCGTDAGHIRRLADVVAGCQKKQLS